MINAKKEIDSSRKMRLKNNLVFGLEKIHLKIFKSKMSPYMKGFLANLSWSFLGGGIANAIVMAVNIFSGRLMGPQEFGKYSLTLVICSYLFVPIYSGLDVATVKLVAKADDQSQAKKYISSSAVFILISALVVSTLVLIFQKQFGAIFSTNTQVIRYAVFFAVILTARNSLDNFIRSTSQFKYQFKGKLIESSLIIIAFLVIFFVFKSFGYSSYINILSFGAIGVSLLYLYRLRDYFHSFDRNRLKELLSHGKFFLFCAIMATFFISLDRLIINRYLSPYELGLYGAYYGVSVTLVTQATQMFNNAFFPAVARNLNKGVFAKLERLILIGFVPTFLLITLIVFVSLKLFGAQYQVFLPYLVAFGLFGTLQAVYLVFTYVVSSLGKSVYKKYLIYYNLINGLTLVMYAGLILTKTVSILFICVALCITYSIIILCQRGLIKKSF